MKFASTVSGRIVAALTLGYVASAYTEKGVRTMKTDSSLPGNQLTFRTLAWAAILGFLATSPSGTEAGGDNHGDGTVFKIDALGNKTVLHQFNGTDGSVPVAGVILDSSGNLYGTTTFGGRDGQGVVFKIAP